MKPWVKWLVNHRIEWLLYPILIAIIPFFIVVYMFSEGLIVGYQDWKYEWQRVSGYKHYDTRTDSYRKAP
jgi:hypothetical protein